MYLPGVDIIGFVASALVFLTFCMRTLLPLRLVAIASNLFFIIYGMMAGLMPILALHLLLLPMNLWRTAQQLQTRRRMRAVLMGEPNLDDLLPFMTKQDYAEGAVVFSRGEAADKLYVVTEGEVVVGDFGLSLPKGSVFGEIGFFSADGKRTATVRASEHAKVNWIDRDTLMHVFRENPDFALFLTRLMVTRLLQSEKVDDAGHL
jgi:CRP/FNR family cyclic AMP-dependent transcriptional regulator